MQWAAVGLSAFFVGLFLYVSLRRLFYPFELERIEASMMTSVWRLRHGYSLYGPPSLEWAPFLYAPLFFWVAAAFSKVLGVGYAALRAVSIVSTLGSFGVIYAMVWKETRRWTAALAAAGFFASLYFLVNGWFDLGRVDSLSVFLFLMAVYATRWMHPLAAAFFWLLACGAKQTYLPLGIASFLVEWARPRRMLLGMGATAGMAWAAIAWLNHATGHWFSYYAFGTVGELTLVPWKEAVLSLPLDYLWLMSIAILLVLAMLLLAPMKWRERDGSFYAILTVLVGGAAWFVRIHRGAGINASMPMFAWVAILLGVAVDRLLRTAEGAEAMGRWKENSVTGVVWLAVAVQLGAHIYVPSWLLGLEQDAHARKAFIEELRVTPGDVWVVNHSYAAILAGKPMHAEMDGYDAVLGRKDAPAVAEFERAIRERQFTAIVLDRPPSEYQPRGVFTTPPFSEAYPLMVPLQEEWVSGADDKPRYVMLPCTALIAAPAGLVDVRQGVTGRDKCP